MKTVTISTHTLRVRNHVGDVYYDLRKLPHRQNLYGLLDQYLSELAGQEPSEDSNHILLTVSQIKRTRRSISACLERGEYGVISKLLNVKEKKVKHQRTVDEAEMMPFFFLAALPMDSDMGVIAFQMESNASVRARFKQEFEDYLRKHCGNVDLEMDNIVPRKMVREFIRKQRVTKLRFVSMKPPRSISEAFRGGNVGKEATIELQVRVKHGSNLLLADGIKEIVNGRKPVNEFVQIRGFNYDTIKAEFDVGGKQRTIDFTDQGAFHSDYDVTRKVQDPEKGHPTFESIYPAAREIVIDIMKYLKLDTEGV